MSNKSLVIILILAFVGITFIPITMSIAQPSYTLAPYCAQTDGEGIIFFKDYTQTNNPLIVNIDEYYKPNFLSYTLVKASTSVIISSIKLNNKRFLEKSP